MKKILSIFLTILMVMSLTVSFAGVDTSDETLLVNENYIKALEEYNLSEKNIVHKTNPDESNSNFLTVIFEDGSTLVVSSDNYSYSKISGEDMIIKSNKDGTSNEAIYDYNNLVEEITKEDTLLDGGFGTESVVYEEQLEGIGLFYEYLYRETLQSRVYTLTITRGHFGGEESYTKYTPVESPYQEWENDTDNFRGHLINTRNLGNDDFIPDLFDKAGLYYPTLDASDINDTVDIMVEMQEDGFAEADEVLMSATATALINYLGDGFASQTTSLVDVVFGMASEITMEVGYSELVKDFDRFVTTD